MPDPALASFSRRTLLTAALGAPAAATLTGCLGQAFDPPAPTRGEQP